MIQILFFFFAALAVGAAINVLTQKHVLYSSLSLIVMLTSVSALFILLQAEFLAVINVIVYAGAIMVLFVFVIMLLNLPADPAGEGGSDRLRWLKPDETKLVWARAEGTPWKQICWRFGIARATAHRRWRYALSLIVYRLNGKRPTATIRSARGTRPALV